MHTCMCARMHVYACMAVQVCSRGSSDCTMTRGSSDVSTCGPSLHHTSAQSSDRRLMLSVLRDGRQAKSELAADGMGWDGMGPSTSRGSHCLKACMHASVSCTDFCFQACRREPRARPSGSPDGDINGVPSTSHSCANHNVHAVTQTYIYVLT